jgi:peptide/nickel transport system substrate-binding protein
VFDASRPPFDDVRVRRAVDASIDRRRLVAAAVAGFGTPATGAVPPDNPLAIPGHERLDVRRADSLLDAADWRRRPGGIRVRGGHALEVTLFTVATGDNPVEQLVQADLAARGVRVVVRQMELGAFDAAAHAERKQWNLLVTGIPGDLTLAHLAGMFATSQAHGALDYASYHSPRLDAGFARAAAAPTDSARHAAWADVQRVLDDEMPVAWLFHARGVQGLSRRLHGVTMDLRGELVTLASWTVEGS